MEIGRVSVRLVRTVKMALEAKVHVFRIVYVNTVHYQHVMRQLQIQTNVTRVMMVILVKVVNQMYAHVPMVLQQLAQIVQQMVLKHVLNVTQVIMAIVVYQMYVNVPMVLQQPAQIVQQLVLKHVLHVQENTLR